MSVSSLPGHSPPENPAPAPLPGELIRTIAPTPTDRTLRLRTSLPVQAYRFAAVTWKMLKIIGRTHQQ